MHETRYYPAPELFKELGQMLKQTLEQQASLNASGLMMTRIALRTQLKTSEALSGVNFTQNRDLYLSGNHPLPHLTIRVTVEAVAKTP